MTNTQRNLLAAVTSIAIGILVGNCSGCSLFVPEGEMTMEVEDGQQ